MSPATMAAKARFFDRIGEYRQQLQEVVIENKALGKVKVERQEALEKPRKYLIGFINGGRIRLKKPFEVSISQAENMIIADSATFKLSARGRNISEALEDLGRQIESLFFSLEQNSNNLIEGLKHTHVRLREYLERTADHRQHFWDQFDAAYEALRNDPDALQQEIEERKLWDNTLMDGIE